MSGSKSRWFRRVIPTIFSRPPPAPDRFLLVRHVPLTQSGCGIRSNLWEFSSLACHGSLSHLDKIHPSPVREGNMAGVRPVIELDRHSLLVNGQHRRRHTFVPGPAVIVNNPPALFDLVQCASQFHDFIMRDRSRIINNILGFFLLF